MNEMLKWLEASPVAAAVGNSIEATAVLSAAHALGFTLVMGSALLANLRLLGVVLPLRSALEVVVPAHRGIATGLAVSIPTGLLLFAPRATVASANGTFRLKMLLLVAAAALQFLLAAPAVRRGRLGWLRPIGAVGVSLWAALAVTACAFILFE